MGDTVPSAPHLHRIVGRSLLAGAAALMVFAALVPAPLGLPADPTRPPNPAKSAWFLLWIQELVSWRTSAIWVAAALGVLLVALPWLPVPPVAEASWFPRKQRGLGVAVLAAALFVFTLTCVGLFLRGRDWSLVWPS
jgi:hypothetical protein